jgi:integrase/recombinase XerD
MEKIVVEINTARWEDNTKHDYKSAVKKYFQWLKGCDEDSNDFPDEVRWIKIRYKEKRKLPEELLTGEELKKLTKVAENPRDIAIILVDFETGGRIGEVLSFLIKHISFDKYGAVFMLDGKTGSRRVRID